MAGGAKVTGRGASQGPTTSGRQSLSLPLSPSVQPGPARCLDTGPIGILGWRVLRGCSVPRSGDSCTPGLGPDAGSTPHVPGCHQVSPVERARTPPLCSVAGHLSRGRWAPSSPPVWGSPQRIVTGGRGPWHRGGGDREQRAARLQAEADDGHRALSKARRPEEAVRPSSYEGPAGVSGCGASSGGHTVREALSTGPRRT